MRKRKSDNGKKGGRPKADSSSDSAISHKANEKLNGKQNESKTESKTKAPEPEPDVKEEIVITTTTTENIVSRSSGYFFSIKHHGVETTEKEWMFRCFLERRTSKRQSVMGCDTLENLLSLYPSHMEQYKRWLIKPIEVRMAAYAYTALECQADDPLKYALKVAEEGQTWDKFQQYLDVSTASVKEKNYEVVIDG